MKKQELDLRNNLIECFSGNIKGFLRSKIPVTKFAAIKYRKPTYCSAKCYFGLSGFVLALFLLGAISSALTKAAHADKVPYTALYGPNYYASTEMDLLSIDFVLRPWDADTEGNLKETVKLPRAYVNFVEGYSHKPARSKGLDTPDSRLRGWQTLPSSIRTSYILVSLGDQDGSPYTIATAKWGKSGSSKNSNGVSLRRANTLLATIRFTGDSSRESYWLQRARKTNKPLLEYDGFLYDPTAATGHIYYNISGGSLKSISCGRSLKRSKANIFCTYSVALGENFIAEIDFPDFRLNGGRGYVVERISVFLRAMCMYFACDSNSIQILANGEK